MDFLFNIMNCTKIPNYNPDTWVVVPKGKTKKQAIKEFLEKRERKLYL